MNIPFYLNIRQKVAVGLTICLLAIGFVGGTSYRYLREIERKQHFVEIADDLSNTILEIRRYEKNFLLYRSLEDLEENRKYIAYGLTVLNSIADEMKNLKGAPQFNLIEKKLSAYQGVMEQIAECVRLKQQLCGDETEVRLREYGKDLVDRANGLVKFEREQILIILKTLESYLLSSLLIFLGMGFFLITTVARKIISPLKIIEETTRHIAQGHFKSLPVVQIFLNLMMNAVQAIQTLPGHIRISAAADENFGIITVEDTGVGIPEKNFSHIFDPFFTTKDVGAGTGLGLSIVYSIIQKHQGTISAESHVEEGSKFVIRLPLYPQAETIK